jgi:hypothetical protein
MLNRDNGKYNALLKGSRILIQDAGPERFRPAGFDRAMLELQRAPLVSLGSKRRQPFYPL